MAFVFLKLATGIKYFDDPTAPLSLTHPGAYPAKLKIWRQDLLGHFVWRESFSAK
jgi:hypothetical protein